MRFKSKCFKVSAALKDHEIALREQPGREGCYDVYFVHHKLREIDLREA